MNELRETSPRWTAAMKLAFIVFAVIGAFFLIAEHRAHLFPYLPWLLLAVCPLMHLFMHHGHSSDHGSHHDDRPAGHHSESRPQPRGNSR